MNAQWTSAAVMINSHLWVFAYHSLKKARLWENSLCIHKIQPMNYFPRWNFLLVHIFGHNPKSTCTVLWSCSEHQSLQVGSGARSWKCGLGVREMWVQILVIPLISKVGDLGKVIISKPLFFPCWTSQKVHLGFSVSCYKTRMDFLANPT